MFKGREDEDSEDSSILKNILSTSGAVHKPVKFPLGCLTFDENENYFKTMIKKALIFVSSERLDLTTKRPRFLKSGCSNSSKPVLFEPVSKVKNMLDRIESEAIKFETLVDDSSDNLPQYGFKISKYGFYSWYFSLKTGLRSIIFDPCHNRVDLQAMEFVYDNSIAVLRSFEFACSEEIITEAVALDDFRPGKEILGTDIVKKS